MPLSSISNNNCLPNLHTLKLLNAASQIRPVGGVFKVIKASTKSQAVSVVIISLSHFNLGMGYSVSLIEEE